MSDAEFRQATRQINAEFFSQEKLNVSKQITRNNCLTAEQIKKIARMHPFQQTRMEYAKFAYDYCADPGNYDIVRDVFHFSTYKSEFDQYVSNQ